VYGLFNKGKAQYCPGEVCDMKARQDIQKTSWLQIFIVIGLLVFIVITAQLFSTRFAEKPTDLWQKFKSGAQK
jgi:hypothetical protein